MDLSKIILESIQTISENKQETSVKFGKKPELAMKDKNVESKNEKSFEDGLDGSLAKENQNLDPTTNLLIKAQKNPKFSAAIISGIAHAGQGAKVRRNPNVKFKMPG